MKNYWDWEKSAKVCWEKYGIFVNFDKGDEYFKCPECGEQILKEDWESENLIRYPICEYNFETDEYDEEGYDYN